jgi:hypothetical protein
MESVASPGSCCLRRFGSAINGKRIKTGDLLKIPDIFPILEVGTMPLSTKKTRAVHEKEEVKGKKSMRVREVVESSIFMNGIRASTRAEKRFLQSR